MKNNSMTSVPERFMTPHTIPKAKLDLAIEKALDKLEKDMPKWEGCFVDGYSIDYRYLKIPNNNWVCGMFTGLYWLAYELSGNPKFRDAALKHLPSYQDRVDRKIGFDDHDVGFIFTPSCVAAYKLTGDERIKKMLLDAVEYYYNTSYSQKGGFILRGWSWQERGGCRTMMDTLMNVPLLFWAGQETGNEKYTRAALSQNQIAANYLIRDDGSSFHHYEFEQGTHKPVRGLTFQGYSDDSCWARGHSWGVYGFAIAYAYSKAAFLPDIHKDITYYLLNHLPADLIPYWDLIFTDGEQPRDSSSSVISICGMHEMSRLLPEDAPQKKIYDSAAAQMLEAVIDHCTGDIGKEYDGLIYHVTGALPQKLGIDECAIYADYHYLEALMRFTNPSWNRYW